MGLVVPIPTPPLDKLQQIEAMVEELAQQRDQALELCEIRNQEIERLLRELAQARLRIEELTGEVR